MTVLKQLKKEPFIWSKVGSKYVLWGNFQDKVMYAAASLFNVTATKGPELIVVDIGKTQLVIPPHYWQFMPENTFRGKRAWSASFQDHTISYRVTFKLILPD